MSATPERVTSSARAGPEAEEPVEGPARAPATTRARPAWPVLLVLAGLLACVPFADSEYYVSVLTIAGLWGLHAVGMTVLLGGSGELNLAYGSFFGVGAYTTAILLDRGVPFALALIAAITLAGVLNVVVGIPLLRTRALFYAIVTLAFAIVAADAFSAWTSVTKGSVGIAVPLVNLDWVPVPVGDVNPLSAQIYGLIWIVVLVMTGLVHRLMRSPFGLVLRGIGGDERLVEGLGLRAGHYRLSAFVFTGLVAGLAGGLYGVFVGYITPGPFTFWMSFAVVIMVIVGGRESVWGSLVAAVGLTLLPEVLRSAESFRLITYALILYAVVVLRRNRIVGGLSH